MRIYFAGSIRGGRDKQATYAELIKHLQGYGKVLTHHVGTPELIDEGEIALTEENIHERDITWLKQADILIADVTIPSLGVGYEICEAKHLNKPTLCLFDPSTGTSLSALVAGNYNVKVVKYYETKKAISHIDEFIKQHSA